jgi:hypothetical protein
LRGFGSLWRWAAPNNFTHLITDRRLVDVTHPGRRCELRLDFKVAHRLDDATRRRSQRGAFAAAPRQFVIFYFDPLQTFALSRRRISAAGVGRVIRGKIVPSKFKGT